jgi:hypothetical protein
MMIKKNRKKTQTKFPVPIPLVALVFVLAGLSLVYVCLQSRTETLGREIKLLEASRDRLRDQLVRDQCEWARLQSPSNLEQALKQHGLVMTWPNRDQIVRIRYDGSLDPLRGLDSRQASRMARADRIVMNVN